MPRAALREAFTADAISIGMLRLEIDRRANVHARDDVFLARRDQPIDVGVRAHRQRLLHRRDARDVAGDRREPVALLGRRRETARRGLGRPPPAPRPAPSPGPPPRTRSPWPRAPAARAATGSR